MLSNLQLRRASCLLLTAMVMVSGCSDPKSESTKNNKPPASSATTIPRPKECGKSDKSAEAKSQECKEALFNQHIDLNGTESVLELDRAKRLEIGNQLCEAARSLSDESIASPRILLIETLSEQLQVSGDDLDQIAAALEPICPEQFRLIRALPPLQAPLRLDLSIEGRGPMELRYTDNTGKAVKERGFAPWQLPVSLESPTTVVLKGTLDASSTEGPNKVDTSQLKCHISSGGSVLAEGQYDPETRTVECVVPRAAVVAAALAPGGDQPDAQD